MKCVAPILPAMTVPGRLLPIVAIVWLGGVARGSPPINPLPAVTPRAGTMAQRDLHLITDLPRNNAPRGPAAIFVKDSHDTRFRTAAAVG